MGAGKTEDSLHISPFKPELPLADAKGLLFCGNENRKTALESGTINPKKNAPSSGVLSTVIPIKDFDRQRSGNIAAAGLSRDV